jgi:hypothetical protein
MAIIKAINSKASIGKGINYITKEEKTEGKLISGINCNPETAIDEMKATKELYDKDTGRQYYHFIQSFNPMDRVSPETAHKLGKEWLERNDKLQGYEVVLATHKDKDHTHNHFIINSVSFESGMKLHTNKKEYEKMKEISNQISRENGLTVPEKSQEKGKITSFNQGKYQAMKRHFEGNYNSYVIDTAVAVSQVKETATSKYEFIDKMEQQGYKTNWKDTSKNVTFINQETGKRVRLSNLEKTFNDNSFTKGGLINEFERNKAERGTSKERGATDLSSRAEHGNVKSDEGNKGTKSANEKLYSSPHGQEHNQSADSTKRDTSNRGHEQESTGRNDFNIEKARDHLRETARDNAENINKLFEPNARARAEEQGKARELEQGNNKQHPERVRPTKSKSWEHER